MMTVSRKQLAVSSMILTILLLTAPCSLQAAIVEVGSQRIGFSTGTNLASQALAFPNTVTTGDFIVVSGATYIPAPGTIAVTSDCSSPLTVAQQYRSLPASAYSDVFIAYGFATSTGTCTVTVTPSDFAYISFGIDAFTGVNSTPLDVSGFFSDTPSTAIVDITPTVNNALIIGVASIYGTNGITPDSAYTQIYEEEDSITYQAVSIVFRIISAASTYSVIWALSDPTYWAAYALSFKPSVVVGGSVVRRSPIIIQ